jgi:phosphopantothenoylcysteine synthetase/decarboxylase
MQRCRGIGQLPGHRQALSKIGIKRTLSSCPPAKLSNQICKTTMTKKELSIITHSQSFKGNFYFTFRIQSYKRRLIIPDEEEEIFMQKKEEAKQQVLVEDSESEEDELLNLDDSDLELGEEKKEEVPEELVAPEQAL